MRFRKSKLGLFARISILDKAWAAKTLLGLFGFHFFDEATATSKGVFNASIFFFDFVY
jgi:hypothetical protein